MAPATHSGNRGHSFNLVSYSVKKAHLPGNLVEQVGLVDGERLFRLNLHLRRLIALRGLRLRKTCRFQLLHLAHLVIGDPLTLGLIAFDTDKLLHIDLQRFTESITATKDRFHTREDRIGQQEES